MIPPTIGRIVHYVLAQHDVEAIAARRGIEFERTGRSEYNGVAVGDRYPAIITQVWGAMKTDLPNRLVNLTVFLDGTDTYWATRRERVDLRHFDHDTCLGKWFYPVPVPEQTRVSSDGPLVGSSTLPSDSLSTGTLPVDEQAPVQGTLDHV